MKVCGNDNKNRDYFRMNQHLDADKGHWLERVVLYLTLITVVVERR